MIEGYIGRPGSGKSYTLTERAIRLARRGRQVFANYPINAPNCWTFAPEQLLDLPPGVIVIDEAHLWFPARMSLKLPPSWLAMLSQTRKNGWDLLWCAQHESRVDRVIRDITSWQWLCTAWLSRDDHPWFFRAVSYEPEFFRRPDKRYTTVWRRFDPAVAGSYDTFERIATAQHINTEADAYASASVSEQRRRKLTLERAAAQRAAVARSGGAGGVDGRAV
ncbi:MAG TPA: zonular occludens toxin domain-containing protein [Cellulomonas sp.]